MPKISSPDARTADDSALFPGAFASKESRPQLVLVGGGMAAAQLVDEICTRQPNALSITVIAAEPALPYNRILLTEVLAGTHAASETWLRPPEWYRQHGVRVLCGARALNIDRERRVVQLSRLPDGACPYAPPADTTPTSELPYELLVLATGSRPFVPPIPGVELDGVYRFRTLEECAAIAAAAKDGRRAIVIGGGLLGLEAARGLLEHRLHVTVVEAAARLMAAQLDEDSAALLRATLEGMGIAIEVGTSVQRIVGRSRVEAVVLADGRSLPCDLVVIAAGIRPIVELARQAGLAVNRGVLCDDQLRTSDPRIFALGECMEHRGVVYGLVDPIREQAKVLADVVTGTAPHARYEGSPTMTRLKVMGVHLVCLGEPNAPGEGDEVVVYREPSRSVYKKLVIRQGRLAGAILLGETDTAGVLTQLFLSRARLPERRADLLFGTTSGAPVLSVFDLQDHVQICNCHGVCKGEIRDAIVVAKCRSLSRLAALTRAGSGCGSCKPLLRQFLEVYAGDELGEDEAEHYYVPGVPLRKPELVREIRTRRLKSVSAVFAALAGGREDPASKPGLASLLRTIWGEQYEDERDARFVNDRVHANIQRDGTFSVVPRIYGGVTSAAELRRIAEVAEKYGVRMVKLTGGQRIDLLGVRKEDLPHIWRDLGMPSGHAYSKAFRTCKSCVGTDFCRFGLGDSIALVQKIERRFQGLEAPHKLKLATAGCPRNCSEAYVKDVGAVAVEGGRWEIYVGGAAGSRVRKGDLLATVGSHEEVLQLVGRFLQYYREHAKYAERTYGFVERVGIEKIRAVVVDDAEGLGASLDAEIEAAVAAYRDPWASEAAQPAYPGQFAGSQCVASEPGDEAAEAPA